MVIIAMIQTQKYSSKLWSNFFNVIMHPLSSAKSRSRPAGRERKYGMKGYFRTCFSISMTSSPKSFSNIG